jgi:hypothetical protein
MAAFVETKSLLPLLSLARQKKTCRDDKWRYQYYSHVANHYKKAYWQAGNSKEETRMATLLAEISKDETSVSVAAHAGNSRWTWLPK